MHLAITDIMFVRNNVKNNTYLNNRTKSKAITNINIVFVDLIKSEIKENVNIRYKILN